MCDINRFDGQYAAGQHRYAIHEHCACAAIAVVAALFRAGEVQLIAEHFEQAMSRFAEEFLRLAVDGAGDV